MSYVKSTAFGPKWEIPYVGEMSWWQHSLLSSYIQRYLPKRDTRYSIKEFYDIVNEKARACDKKEKLLNWLSEMLLYTNQE